MAYVNHTNRPNPTALAGAIAIPAAVGALLVVGLAVTKSRVDPDVLTGWQLTDPPTIEPLPKPEPPKATEPTPKVTQAVPARPQSLPILPSVPQTNIDLGSNAPITNLPKFDSGALGPVDFGLPKVAPAATLDPVTASPRGEPGRWITNDDYRTSWINRGFSGVAGFALAIDAQGRISDCTITRSTGHDALDAATCRLLERRARFDPARDGAGDPVAGTYRSSVNWQIPE